jgi:hypothetical protein
MANKCNTNHLGEISKNKHGTKMKIIRYVNTADIEIEFQDDHRWRTNTTYSNFKIGQVKNPYDRTVCGVGYIGVGKHKGHKPDSNLTRVYGTWNSMIERCYSKTLASKFCAYEDCTVCEEWHNFQIFADWYEDNFYDVGDERMHLDKDIIKPNNKVYCPEYCMFVPQSINMIFMTKARKDDLPNGITQNISGTYVAHYNGKRYGTYKTLEEAVEEHDKQKQLHIERVVEEYGDKIPPRVYNYLIKWKENLAA